MEHTMKTVKRLAIVLGAYVALVVAFECLVGFMGQRQATSGVGPGESWIVITTTDADGAPRKTVIAGVESGGQLYIAANHWPRAWYERSVANPEVEITRAGQQLLRRAVPVTGEELTRIERDYHLPLAVRFLTGFPPRAFLRLDPR
jgi:hypothetical protein